MRRVALILSLMILIQLAGPVARAQNATGPADSEGVAVVPEADASDELKQELEKLKKAVAALEERLKAQEKQIRLRLRFRLPLRRWCNSSPPRNW